MLTTLTHSRKYAKKHEYSKIFQCTPSRASLCYPGNVVMQSYKLSAKEEGISKICWNLVAFAQDRMPLNRMRKRTETLHHSLPDQDRRMHFNMQHLIINSISPQKESISASLCMCASVRLCQSVRMCECILLGFDPPGRCALARDSQFHPAHRQPPWLHPQ